MIQNNLSHYTHSEDIIYCSNSCNGLSNVGVSLHVKMTMITCMDNKTKHFWRMKNSYYLSGIIFIGSKKWEKWCKMTDRNFQYSGETEKSGNWIQTYELSNYCNIPILGPIDWTIYLIIRIKCCILLPTTSYGIIKGKEYLVCYSLLQQLWLIWLSWKHNAHKG